MLVADMVVERFWTSVQALYNPKHLGLVEPPEKVAKPEWVLVYGGSSEYSGTVRDLYSPVSGDAFSCLRSLGYPTCPPVWLQSRHHRLGPQSRAAQVLWGRRDDRLQRARPRIKDQGSDGRLSQVRRGHDWGGRDQEDRRTGDRAIGWQSCRTEPHAERGGRQEGCDIHSCVSWFVPLHRVPCTDLPGTETYLYTVNGYSFKFRSTQLPAMPEDKAHMAGFLRKLPQLVSDGALKPLPIKFWEGGLEGVKDGLQYMREGKVHAEKIVYRI